MLISYFKIYLLTFIMTSNISELKAIYKNLNSNLYRFSIDVTLSLDLFYSTLELEQDLKTDRVLHLLEQYSLPKGGIAF